MTDLTIDQPRRSRQELAELLRDAATRTEAGDVAEGDQLEEALEFWPAVYREAADRLSPPTK